MQAEPRATNGRMSSTRPVSRMLFSVSAKAYSLRGGKAPAHYLERHIGILLFDQGRDGVDNVKNRVFVRKPAHRTDEHQGIRVRQP
jgi:hypothetical protein